VAFDTLIRNGTVMDGTGRLRYDADVGINGGKIEAIGHLEDKGAALTLDATGLIVAPGFIDMHSHSDTSMLDDPGGDSKAHQGVTTEVTGNCSQSPFPARPGRPTPMIGDPASNVEADWTDLDGWANRLETHGISLNIVPQLGQAALQMATGAIEDRLATVDEMREMKRLAVESMEQGAFSLSTGLSLSPSGYMSTDEVVALCQAVAHYDGVFYVTHARVGAGRHLSSIQEAIEIGQRAGMPVQFSHMAIIDRRVYGQGPEMLALLETAREEGLDITYDVYPYTAAGAGLNQTIPIWAQAGTVDEYMARLRDPDIRSRIRAEVAAGIGGLSPLWDTWVLASASEANLDLVGRSVEEIAAIREVEPAEAVLQLAEEERGRNPTVVHNRTESDVRYFLSHPLAMIGSDGNAISPSGVHSQKQLHPRFYGTYPRILGRYVRDQSLMSLETAVNKMTGMPAERLRLKDRGQVKEGYVADLAIFDPNTVIDHSTFEKPHQLSEGVTHVLVGGESVVLNGKHTQARPGRVLRRGA
jgi:N-acyl-D-aspartate/D-glutamate deacylase